MVVGGEDPPNFGHTSSYFRHISFYFRNISSYFRHISCNTVMSGLGSWRGWCFEGMNPALSADASKIFVAMLSYQVEVLQLEVSS